MAGLRRSLTPPGLDQELAAMGMQSLDDTRVMVAELARLPLAAAAPVLPADHRLEPADALTYAQVVGAFRGSPQPQRAAHAERLSLSPVPYQGWLLRSPAGDVVACAQTAAEAEIVGLYDVFTAPDARGQGLATALCSLLLHRRHSEGAATAYLQVEGDNAAARSVYHRLGFADAYAYHYRTPDPAAA